MSLTPHDRRKHPPQMSKEQLDFFTAESQRAVRKALHRHTIGATIAFVILLAGLLLALGVSNHDEKVARDAIVKSGTVVAVDSCNARYNDRLALRNLFVRLQTAARAQAKQEGLSPNDPRVEFAVQFYRDELQRLPLPDCRKAAHILTDAPYPPVLLPRPKHP